MRHKAFPGRQRGWAPLFALQPKEELDLLMKGGICVWVTVEGLRRPSMHEGMIRDQGETLLIEERLGLVWRAVQGMPQENLAGGDEETRQREYT